MSVNPNRKSNCLIKFSKTFLRVLCCLIAASNFHYTLLKSNLILNCRNFEHNSNISFITELYLSPGARCLSNRCLIDTELYLSPGARCLSNRCWFDTELYLTPGARCLFDTELYLSLGTRCCFDFACHTTVFVYNVLESPLRWEILKTLVKSELRGTPQKWEYPFPIIARFDYMHLTAFIMRTQECNLTYLPPSEIHIPFVKTRTNVPCKVLIQTPTLVGKGISVRRPCDVSNQTQLHKGRGNPTRRVGSGRMPPTQSRDSHRSADNYFFKAKDAFTKQELTDTRSVVCERANCKLSSQLKNWELLLRDDIDKDFVMQGVEWGFDILEGKQPIFAADMQNYKSTTHENVSKVERQIKSEIELGNYRIVNKKPSVISSLGAVSKSNGGIRLIHDMSRPLGGINSFVENSSCSYNTVDLATNCMKPNCYLTKLDLKAAYRSIPIASTNFKYTGLSWHFKGDKSPTYLIDTKLPFGAKKACRIFSRISDAVARSLRRQNVLVVNYLDDLMIISDTKEKCWLDLDKTVNQLVCLGFDINWDKMEPPSQFMSFLGVQIDTITRTLSLPNKKFIELLALLQDWVHRKRVSKKNYNVF